MGYAEQIILEQPDSRDELIAYENGIGAHTLGDNFQECQSLNERTDEFSLAKLLALYLSGEREIEHEVKRILTWAHREEKAQFLIKQLKSPESAIVLRSIELMGILKESLTIPSLEDQLDADDVEVVKHSIDALGEINDPVSIRIVKKLLHSHNKEYLLHALRTLSKNTAEVSWQTFKKLLMDKDIEIRREAAFAIAIRKSPSSSHAFAKSIEAEPDRDTKHMFIQYAGMIPGERLLKPLLAMVVHDEDHKTKLLASRTLHRIQGLLPAKALFKLRNDNDPMIKTEVISRLGQYGLELDRLKKFLRKTLATTDNLDITLACIQALGYIAEHDDVETLTAYLYKDSLSAYNAAMALTRTWRYEDSERVLDALQKTTSSTLRQVFLKYIIHRRGFSIDPKKLLDAIHVIHDEDENINVRYLACFALEFAPTTETIEYLMPMFSGNASTFEKEATSHSLTNLIKHHEHLIIDVIRNLRFEECCDIMQHIPPDKDPPFYTTLAEELFSKKISPDEKESLLSACDRVYRTLALNPEALKQFLKAAMGTPWEDMFIKALCEFVDADTANFLKDDLIDILEKSSAPVRKAVLDMLMKIREPKVLPVVITIAESGTDDTVTERAKEIVKTYAAEGII